MWPAFRFQCEPMGKIGYIPAKECFSHTEDKDASDIFCDVFEQNRFFFRNASIHAAIDLSIFDLLTRPLTCEQLSLQLRTQPNRLHALLNVLVLEGLLQFEKKGSTYFYLARGTPAHGPGPPEYGWGQLAQVIRTNRPLDEIEPSKPASDANLRFHDHLFEIGYPAGQWLWKHIGMSQGHLLDIGSGSGAYSAAFLEMYRDATATLVDREEILELARHRLKNYAGRLKFEARDAFKPIPGLYDIALLTNMLHLYGPPDCAKLIAVATQSLQKDGCLVIKDQWIEPDRSGPAVSVYFTLNMALYTKAGEVYSGDRICRWVTKTGFTDLEVLNNSSSLIVKAKNPSKTNA